MKEEPKPVNQEQMIKDMLAKVSHIFEEMVVKLTIVANGVQVLVFNEEQKEQLSLKYGKQEIFAEIDLPFKEITTIRAMGLEIQTKEHLMAFETIYKKFMENAVKIKEITKKDLVEIQDIDV